MARQLPNTDGEFGEPDASGLCAVRKGAPKQELCYTCKADVQAARRGAEAKDELAWFEALKRAGGEESAEFMREIVKNNGADRRKYAQRARFDFLKCKEARLVQNSCRLSYKAG